MPDNRRRHAPCRARTARSFARDATSASRRVYIGGPAFGARDRPQQHGGTSNASRATPTVSARASSSRTTPSCATTSWRRRAAWPGDTNAGADALIVQDMGCWKWTCRRSSCTPARRPTSARREGALPAGRGLQQMVLARELTLEQIRPSRRGARGHAGVLRPRRAVRAYSGNCYISHAHTGRSANRGSCSQECRLPYTVTDAQAASSRTTSTC